MHRGSECDATSKEGTLKADIHDSQAAFRFLWLSVALCVFFVGGGCESFGFARQR